MFILILSPSPLSFFLPPFFGILSHHKWVRPQPTWDQVPWVWAPATAPSSPCSTCPTTARTSTSPAARPPSPPTPSSKPQPSRPPSRLCPRPRPQPSLSPPRRPRPPPPRKSPPRRRKSRVWRKWRNDTPGLIRWKICPRPYPRC